MQVLDVIRNLLADMDGCDYWPHAQLDPCEVLNVWVCNLQLHRILGPCIVFVLCRPVLVSLISQNVQEI